VSAGALVAGVLAGLGVAVGWTAVLGRGRPRGRIQVPRRPPRVLLAAGAVAAAVGVAAAVTGTALLAVLVGVGAVAGLSGLRHARRQRRAAEARAAWPDAVEALASAVRAGMSLPDAVADLGRRGPQPLREPFQGFARDYRATGRFAASLDGLRDALADPVGDRVVETLRLARELGGGELGPVLRTLAAFLREDARTRAELRARQSWTVSAARLAVAAPWVVLTLLATRPAAAHAYATPLGVVVVLGGAAACTTAYVVMTAAARLPVERRVGR